MLILTDKGWTLLLGAENMKAYEEAWNKAITDYCKAQGITYTPDIPVEPVTLPQNAAHTVSRKIFPPYVSQNKKD